MSSPDTLVRSKRIIRQPSPFGIHGTALQVRGQRMALLASNIANAATPNYKARDIDFTAALNARLSNDAPAEQAATRFRVPTMPTMDGNTVELATEQMAFAENAVGYSTSLSFLRGRVDTLTRAIRGE